MHKISVRDRNDRFAQKYGFENAASFADYLIREGWCPIVVQRETGLPKQEVDLCFARHPERLRQWY